MQCPPVAATHNNAYDRRAVALAIAGMLWKKAYHRETAWEPPPLATVISNYPEGSGNTCTYGKHAVGFCVFPATLA